MANCCFCVCFSSQITGSVQAVQDAIIQQDQRLSKAMVRSGSLHVTMLVMRLSNEEEINM